MDAPFCQTSFSVSGSQVEIAAMHSASVWRRLAAGPDGMRDDPHRRFTEGANLSHELSPVGYSSRTLRTIPQFARIVPFFCRKDRSSCSAESLLTAIFSKVNRIFEDQQVETRHFHRDHAQPILVIFLFVLAWAHSQAHADVWQPSPGHVQVPIWPGAVPDAMPNPKPESVGPPPDASGGPGLTMSAGRQ